MTKKKSTRTSRARKAAKKGKRRRSRFWLAVRLLFYLGFIVGLGGVAVLAGTFYVYSLDLPDIFHRDDFQPKQITRIYSADGHVIDELVAPEGRRTVVPFDLIAQPMKDAILAAEDADFYKHQGLDYYGMVRALYYAVRFNRRQGASTITQQVVKNLVLTPEKRVKRKVQEIMLARRLEQHLSKDDILYIYLNQIYFGHGNYGVYEAARHYFAKEPKDLTLAEAALLAGLVQSPERLSPLKHPERAQKRRQYVLEQMWKKGFVDEAVAKAAMNEPLGVADRKEVAPYRGRGGYYAAHVRKLLQERYPEEEVAAMGLVVRTAMVMDRQIAAENALRQGLVAFDEKKKKYRPLRNLDGKALSRTEARLRKKHDNRDLRPGIVYQGIVRAVDESGLDVAIGGRTGRLSAIDDTRFAAQKQPPTKVFSDNDLVEVMVEAPVPANARAMKLRFAPSVQGGIVAIDRKSRHVEALVGGWDFGESKFNRATQARRQTGSAFKPIVYGAAIAQRQSTPATIWLDAPKPFVLPGGKSWSPKNADGKFLGPITMRRALALSRNVIAVRIAEKVGIDAVQDFARKLGFSSPLVDNLTMSLGSSELSVLEVTSAYTTLASLGRRAEPVFIVEISDSFARRLFEAPPAELAQTVPPEVAWLVVDMMKSVVTEGTASRVGRKLGRPAAGKTGTTNKSRDAWFVGFTPQKVAGVWVGYDDNRGMGRGAAGGTVAAPVWLDYMLDAHRGLPKKDFGDPPLGIVDARIDRKTGLLARDGQKGARREFFLSGMVPTEYAPEEDESTTGDFLLSQGAGDDEPEPEGDIAESEAPPDEMP